MGKDCIDMVKRKKRSMTLLWKGGLHRFVYGRCTTKYVDILFNRIVPFLGRRGRKRLARNYHSKILTHRQAEAIVTLDRDIPLQDLETIIPYERARNILLSAHPDIVVFECGCRKSSEDPCQPTQVCMVVGQPFVDLILNHRPGESRRLTTDEALELLREEHERGHVHCAWFKHAMEDRFYAICNCCRCHCGGIEAMTVYGVKMLAPSGHSADRVLGKCVHCGACAGVCPFGAFVREGEKVIFYWDRCMGCGVCIDKCPEKALKLVLDPGKGIPLEVDRLITG